MTPTSIAIAGQDGLTRVSISGDITESSDFSSLLSQPTSTLVLDLSGVNQINSCGVREWVNAIHALEKSGKALTFERCSFAVVSQLNMIASFRGNAEVRSIQVPFFCGECNERYPRLVELTQDRESVLGVADEAPPCPQCGKTMEFDDLPQTYFAFYQGR